MLEPDLGRPTGFLAHLKDMEELFIIMIPLESRSWIFSPFT